MKNGKLLEIEVREILDEVIPASTLSGVCLFQPDLFVEDRDFGTEIDHLVHVRANSADHLLIIECKAQRIQFRGQAPSLSAREWVVEYTRGGESRQKFIKSQMFAQAQALLQNLFPKERAETVHLHAIVVSSASGTPKLADRSPTDRRITYHAIGLDALSGIFRSAADLAAFLSALDHDLSIVRVQQSDLLRRIRHGLVVPELGHPEVPNGMRYVSRCREVLDCELTKFFKPTGEGRWVINGAAGMGKTVLLAYAATVFASGNVLREKRSDRQIPKRELVRWEHPQIEAMLPKLGRRKVVVLGLNPKQREVLAHECKRFSAEFYSIADEMDDLTLAGLAHPPRIELWHEQFEIRADVLLVDEAHDLPPLAQARIRDWWLNGKGQRYLILACDRHQRLRLMGDHASILDGVSFSGCSTRLTRNYRSPSPIYGAALALMFRWFGKGGAKVLPTRADFENSFGFAFGEDDFMPVKAGELVSVSLRNDTHPANYWSFTVAHYADWRIAYHWIEEWKLNHHQVLWVRFSHTDNYLDQQGIPCVQLQDLQVHNPDHVIDTHIKGREFPVVVIEGLPAEAVDQTDLATMLAWRRRLYLCASRATCFLFFVYPHSDGSAASESWNAELRALLSCCSMPSNRNESSSKFWRFRFDYPEKLLRPDIFAEIEKADTPETDEHLAQKTAPPVAPASAELTTPVTSRSPATSNTPPPAPAKIHSGNSIKAPTVLPPSPAAIAATPSQRTINSTRVGKAAIPAPQPAVAPPVVSPPQDPGTPITEPESALMREKNFQRLYGHEKGWKQIYARYLKTGVLPHHLKIAPVPKQQSANGHSPQKETRLPESSPKAPAKSVPVAPPMTPRMISYHFGVLPFKVLKAAMEILKRRAERNYMPQLDQELHPNVVAEIYRNMSKELPTPEDILNLRGMCEQLPVTPSR